MGEDDSRAFFKSTSNFSDLNSILNNDRKKQVAENTKTAVQKRGSIKSFTEVVTNNFHSSPESVKDVLEGKRSLRGEEILFLEVALGIHRDEILGPIDDKRIRRKVLKNLDNWFMKAYEQREEDGNELGSKLSALLFGIHKLFNDVASNEQREEICDDIIFTMMKYKR